MKRIWILLLILIACSNHIRTQAQTQELVNIGLSDWQKIPDQPVHSSLALGMGQGKVRDTYLTNLIYSGTALDIRYERQRAMANCVWDNHQWIDADLMYGAEDKSSNSSMHAGRFRYRYAMHRQVFNYSSIVSASLGMYAGTDLGFNYNLKMASSNNPATVRATLNSGISAKVRYNYVLRRQRCRFDLQLQTPLLGAALMPEYGASYYETFYLDHTDKDVHFTSLHNQQDLDVRLTTEIPFSVIPHMTRFGTSLRLGMAYHIETMDINHIITRQSTFQFVLGWTWHYYPINPLRK